MPGPLDAGDLRDASLDGRPPPLDAPPPPDVPRPDGGGFGLPPYAACDGDSECASGECYEGHSGYTWDHGYCVPPCAGGCPAASHGEVSCEHPSEICRIFCGTGELCEGGWSCSLFSRLGAPGSFDDSGECLPPGIPVQAVPFDPCTSESECWPGICAMIPAGQRCVRACGPGFSCAPGFMCRMSATRGEVCLPTAPP